MERLFQIVAVALAVATAYFLWTNGLGDYAFVTSVFAVSAFFLSYRFRLKTRIKAREDAEESLPE